MNKPEFIKLVATKTEVTNKDAEIMVNAVLDTIGDQLHKGEEINFVGFGSFSITDRKSRIGRNPKTGEEITIPASKIPHFKSGKNLKELVN